jgi:ELWxxDGT repeat protein
MRFRSVLVAFLATNPLLSQALIKDFNTTPYPDAASSGAVPIGITKAGNLLLVAYSPGSGRELWSSDGTQSGTQLLKDVRPGFESSQPVQFVTLPSGLILFTARTLEHGWELWRTDGTTVGTNLVKDILPGEEGSVAVGLTVVGNEVVFLANDGVHGIEPWKSDGTMSGTVMIADTNPFGGMSNGTAQLAARGSSHFVFTALLGQAWELWQSDGTANGTSKIVNLPTSSQIFQPARMTTFGNRVLFESRTGSGDDAWVTDGTALGTFALGSGIESGFQVVGTTAYFSGADLELWRTDGTVAGTQQVVDLTPGPSSWSRPALLGSIGSDVVFTAFTGVGLERDLFVSDGTAAGTTTIGVPGSFNYYFADGGTRVGGLLYFQGTEQGVNATWRTDGTAAGTVMLTAALGDSFVDWNGTAFFRASETATGSELWSSDGTPPGTQLHLDLYSDQRTLDADAYLLATIRDEVLLMADDGVIGKQLWLTDGTSAGTRAVSSFAGGIYSAGAVSNDKFLWASIAGPGLSTDPWVSDSALTGFQQLPVSVAHPGFRTGHFVAAGDKIIFSGITNALGAEPWISDGTLAGTRPIADLVTGSGNSYPNAFWHAQGKTFFLATTPASGAEPWVTDGTAAGTLQLADTVPGSTGMLGVDFVMAGDRVFFSAGAASPTERELWVSNGTAAGTYMLDVEPGPIGSSPSQMTPVGDRIVFAAVLNGEWRAVVSDGTLAGTFALPPLGTIQRIARINAHTALMIASENGQSIGWRTDGTVAGTQQIAPMRLHSNYLSQHANPTDDKLMIELVDPVVGREFFVTDGTTLGTQLLIDLGLQSASPLQVMRAGKRLVTLADDGIHGRELLGFDVRLLGDETVARVGFGCAGTGGHVPTLSVVGEADASNPGPFDLVVDGALAFAPVVLALGTDSDAQPLSGCTLFSGGTIAFGSMTADGLGSASLSIQLNPALLGMRFVAQAFPIDIGGPVFGIASATAGLELVIGP